MPIDPFGSMIQDIKTIQTIKSIQGAQNVHFVQGAQGLKGEHGESGPKGDQGPKGDKGEHGESGPKGDQGSKGYYGIKGDKGDKGDSGIKGEHGESGPKGEHGESGPKGDKGYYGTKGDKGDKGDSGNIANLLPIEGGSMSGNITMGHKHTVSHIRDPEETHEVASKGYVDKMVSQPLKLMWSGYGEGNQIIELAESPEDFKMIHITSVYNLQHAFTSTFSPAAMGKEIAYWHQYVAIHQKLIFHGDRHKLVYIKHVGERRAPTLTLRAVYGQL